MVSRTYKWSQRPGIEVRHGTGLRCRLAAGPTPRYGRVVPRGRHAVVSGKLPSFVADAESTQPLYAQVADHLRRIIDDGLLRSGDRLDGEIGLAERWGISRQTMRRATGELVGQGVLLRTHGVGTQVATRPGWHAGGVRSLYDEMLDAGRSPSTVVRSLAVTSAEPDVAEALELAPGEPVYEIERLRSVDGEPLALMRNWLPRAVADLDVDVLQHRGLYEVLRTSGVEMRIARQSVGAEAVGRAEARVLGIRAGSPVLSVRTVTYGKLGRPVESGRHLYRADTFRFRITNVEP